jgi:hypothetical protein
MTAAAVTVTVTVTAGAIRLVGMPRMIHDCDGGGRSTGSLRDPAPTVTVLRLRGLVTRGHVGAARAGIASESGPPG